MLYPLSSEKCFLHETNSCDIYEENITVWKKVFMKESIDLSHLAKLVRQRLAKEHLTLREAAGLSGISFSTLSRIINCQSVPDTNTMLRLSRWLNISIDKLMKPSSQYQYPIPFNNKKQARAPLNAD
jgi:predicted DNA-binding transcriptional regulator AlpA